MTVGARGGRIPPPTPVPQAGALVRRWAAAPELRTELEEQGLRPRTEADGAERLCLVQGLRTPWGLGPFWAPPIPSPRRVHTVET